MDTGSSAGSPRRTVLVVEDEKALALLLTRRFEAEGHTVLLAADGAVACEVHAAHADAIDVVVLDLTLPKLGGEEVLQRIRARSPGVPIVVTSGFGGHELVERLVRLPKVRFVAKPYRVGELLEAVRALLP